MPKISASKGEKIILIVMGLILAVSLVVLYQRDSKPSASVKDPSSIELPGHDHESENPEANVAQPEAQ